MNRAPATAEPEGAPYRGRWAERAVFELTHARYGIRVGAGVASAVVVVGLMAGVLFLFPDLARQQVSPVHLLVVAFAFIGAIAGAVRIASGPAVALSFDGDVVSLITHGGKTIARCEVAELGRETATCRMSVIVVPAVVLRFMGARRLVVAVNWPEERLPWRSGGAQLGEPSHLVPVPLWPRLLEHLQLATELANPQLTAGAPQAPLEVAPQPLWRRYQWWGIAIIPIGSLLLGVLWPGMAEPSPDCWAAERCCLAIANQQVPVSAEALRACTALAMADEERCGGLRKQAESDAAAAEVRCEASVLERYDAYPWSERASSLPGSAGQPSSKPRYPRVSCQDAARALQQAVQDRRNGDLLVIRPTSLMIQAITLSDPNAFVYCDGYPLPVVNPNMGSVESPIVGSAGPHAVLLQPLASGHFDVRQTCWGCNSVGRETSRR